MAKVFEARACVASAEEEQNGSGEENDATNMNWEGHDFSRAA